jgi:hypothetical protein
LERPEFLAAAAVAVRVPRGFTKACTATLIEDWNMHTRMLWLLVLVMSTTLALPKAALPQPGRLRVLADLPAQSAACGEIATNDATRRSGVARILKVDSDSLHRAVKLATDASGRPLMLTDLVFGRPNESEQVTVVFRTDGGIRSGFWQYHPPGLPAVGTKDTNSGLQAADTARARMLAAEVLKKCAR